MILKREVFITISDEEFNKIFNVEEELKLDSCFHNSKGELELWFKEKPEEVKDE